MTGFASVLDRSKTTTACLTVLNITVKWRAFFEIQIGLPPLFGNALSSKTKAFLVIDVLSQVTVRPKVLHSFTKKSALDIHIPSLVNETFFLCQPLITASKKYYNFFLFARLRFNQILSTFDNGTCFRCFDSSYRASVLFEHGALSCGPRLLALRGIQTRK